MKPLPNLRVTGTRRWKRYTGYRASEAYLDGQVTRIECDGIVAYVRENLKIQDTFLISSAARLGICGNGKRSTRLDYYGRGVLELAAPKDRWESIAQVVQSLDAHKRPVLRNPAWTVTRGADQFKP